HYWGPIVEKYKLNLTVTNKLVDPTFRFMTIDHDGKIRMDPSSPYAMRSLLGKKDQFDVAFACDTDHDRHGIVTKHAGLGRKSCGGQDRGQQRTHRSRYETGGAQPV